MDGGHGSTHRVRALSADAGHDGDDDVLLDGERARVDGHAKNTRIGERIRPELAQREREQLRYDLYACANANKIQK